VLLLAGIPALAIPLVGALIALLQGMMAMREESIVYAARAATAVVVLLVFGASVAASLVELMRFSMH